MLTERLRQNITAKSQLSLILFLKMSIDCKISRGGTVSSLLMITPEKHLSIETRNFDLENDFQDEAAGAAHWAASRYYDWLKDTFGFNSIDNQGHELRSVIHLNEGESVVNAFWNGRFATFGDGRCGEVDPLTSIDVVSHEFTHGLTRNNSGLVYRYESGGLNEAMSDMFGKGLEYYLNPDGFTWEVGRDFQIDPSANPFRNMSDPNLLNDPKYLQRSILEFSRRGRSHQLKCDESLVLFAGGRWQRNCRTR